jgi:hypothetical protein
MSIFNNSKEVRHCLIRAEDFAEPRNWEGIADAWKEFFNDDEAHNFLKRAEGWAKNASDWIEIAWQWVKLSDLDRGRRCLVHAENLSKNSKDFRTLARKWKEYVKDDERAHDCLMRAEKMEKGWYVVLNRLFGKTP